MVHPDISVRRLVLFPSQDKTLALGYFPTKSYNFLFYTDFIHSLTFGLIPLEMHLFQVLSQFLEVTFDFFSFLHSLSTSIWSIFKIYPELDYLMQIYFVRFKIYILSGLQQ